MTQLLLAVVVLITITVSLLLDPVTLRNELFISGVVVIFMVTMAAAVLPWSLWPRWLVMLLPVVDILAIVMIRMGEPALGAGLLLVFPVTWLAGYFGRNGAFLGPTVSSLALWFSVGTETDGLSLADIPRLLLLPISLIFVSTATYQTARRTAAQRVLLKRQSTLMTQSFDHARAQELMLDAVLNAVSFAVVAYDRNGRRTHRNEAFRLLKLRYGSHASAQAEGRIFGRDRQTPLCREQLPLERLLAGESFEDELIWMTSESAPPIALAVTGRQLTDVRGARTGSVMVQRDVTAELQALRARDDLIASVSHELRTPLTSILGYLDLALDDEELSAETRQHLDVVFGNSERMLAIVSDLLHAARDSNHTFLMTYAPCDLNQIVAESLAAAEPAARERHLRIGTVSPGAVPLMADGFRLRQVVDNLVTNALKYNRDGGSITARLVPGPGSVVLSIADTGLGMSDQDRARMFQRFYRSDAMRHSTTPGTGLGMSICRDIVDQHGGEISVASELGVGTIVTVTLPLEPQRNPE